MMGPPCIALEIDLTGSDIKYHETPYGPTVVLGNE